MYTYSSACSTKLRRRLRHLLQAASDASNPNPFIGSGSHHGRHMQDLNFRYQ